METLKWIGSIFTPIFRIPLVVWREVSAIISVLASERQSASVSTTVLPEQTRNTNMSEQREFVGIWWLPEDPSREIAGSLSCDVAGNMTLQLYALRDVPDDKNIPTILGISNDEKQITLNDCRLQNRTFNIFDGNATKCTFYVTSAFVGKRFFEGVPKFEYVDVRFANLDSWTDTRTIHEEDGSQEDEFDFMVKYVPEPSVVATVGNFDIGFIERYNTHSNLHSLRLETSSWVRIKSRNGELPLNDYQKTVLDIQNFLNLAMPVPTYPLKLRGFASAEPHSIEILQRGFVYQVDLRNLHSWDMVFKLADIKDSFSEKLHAWMRDDDWFTVAKGLYFGTRLNSQLYTENAFLSLSQTIEAYHREVFGGEYMEEAKYLGTLYKTLGDAIPADIDNDFKQSLKTGTLRYANQYSLRKRIRELTQSISNNVPLALSFISTPEKRREFANRVTDTRNYYTHYTDELRVKAINGLQLVRLVKQLDVLVLILMLQEADFDNEEIGRFLQNHLWYRKRFH